MSAPTVHESPDAQTLAHTVAVRAAQVLSDAVAERGEAHMVLTGGSILESVLTELADPSLAPWPQVHVWWGDERFVAADSDDRNDKPAAAKFLDKVPLDPAKVHRMPAATGDDPDPDAAAAAYAADLLAAAGADTRSEDRATDVPAFDVALLGIGPDGHCCSLFPNHPGTRRVDTSVTAVRESPKPPPTRLSLTFPALDAARRIWFIASGAGKAHAVTMGLSGADRTVVPSAGPRGTLETLWLIDADAAGELYPERG